MEVGSVDGLHLGGLGSMGVVIGQRASSEARLGGFGDSHRQVVKYQYKQ